MKDFKTLNEQIVNDESLHTKKASTACGIRLCFCNNKNELWCIFTCPRNGVESIFTGIKRMVIFVNRTRITI